MTRDMPQSQTTDQPTARRGRDTEHVQPHESKNTAQSKLIAKLESRGGSRISGKGDRMYKGMRGSRLLC